MNRVRLLSLLFAVAVTAACGGHTEGAANLGPDAGTDPAGPDAGTLFADGGSVAAAERYFPMATGATWSYAIVDNGVTGTKTTTVEATEQLTGFKAGITAYRVRTIKASGGETVSWQEDTGSAILRHREQAYAPDGTLKTDELYFPRKLRIDEQNDRVTIGATFRETYTEDVVDHVTGNNTRVVKDEDWTVEAIDEPITVPAGTFNCVRVHRVSSSGSDKRYWFARGVGKVREQSATRTEELSGYSL